ncbi:UVR8 [Symbiodinium sp. CCMP2592]|nr:UVR8 [Symbiodinium sp. CCMP2592]
MAIQLLTVTALFWQGRTCTKCSLVTVLSLLCPACCVLRSCGTGDDGCITSTNFPESYPPGDACVIEVEAENRMAIGVVAFSSGHGKLRVNDVLYSGTEGPQGVVPRGSILWSSDIFSSGLGWKMCLEEEEEEEEEEAVLPRALQANGTWTLLSGTCRVDGVCVSSSNFPEPYPDFDRCEIEAPPVDPQRLLLMDVVEFSTEDGYDYLMVNGVPYSGNVGPHEQVPGNISWHADDFFTASGWKICLREALQIDFHELSCNFEWDTCLWFSSANSTWHRVAGEVNGGNWVLEATGTVSEDRTFVLESVRVNSTNSSSLTVSYQMSGSSSVSLALQSQTEASGWTTIFLRTGDKGPSWHTSFVAVPDGTFALRLLANIIAVEDVVRVDSLWAWHMVSSEASKWTLIWGLGTQRETPILPARHSSNLQHVDVELVRSCKVDGDCISSPDFPADMCIFKAPPVDPQRLLIMDVVAFSTYHSHYLVVNGVPYSGDVGLALKLPLNVSGCSRNTPQSFREKRALHFDFHELSCNFEWDTCLWFSSANSTWHRVAGEVNGGNWVLEATGTVSEDRTFVLESVRVNSTNSSSLTVSYQMSGSSSVSLALQSQTEASGWTTIFLRTGDKGPSWHASFVAVPDGTIALRLLANITAVEDVVRVGFEVDFNLGARHSEGHSSNLQHVDVELVRPCKVDGDCISSPDFPDMYPNSHECIFTGPPVDQRRLLVMDVVEFSTEDGYDYLMVNGVPYSGNVGPHEQVPGNISWHADAIVPASGWNICLREVHFQDLSCNFERDTCLWFSSANSTWHRVAGEVNGGNWVLEATGTVSEDRTFVLESVRVNSTNSSSLTVSYQMSGSSSVSLALQSQTEASGWTTIFLRTGDKGPSWHTSFVAVPDGTFALRLLANIIAVEDVVRVDSLWAWHMVSSEASKWTLIWGPCKVDGNCISSPDFPDMYPNSHECIFTGPPVDQRRLLVMDVVEFSTEDGYDDLMVNGVRYSGDVGPHEQVPRGTIAWHADAIVPASGWNICLREVHFQDLSCNFERDTCLWFSSANSTWHRVAGEVNGGNWVLEATGTVSEDRTFVLESVRVNSTNSSSLTVSYQMSGSSSVSLALQSQAEASGWTTIFLRTGDKGPSWHTSFVEVPDGTFALRLLANIIAVEDVVRVDSLWAWHMVSSEASKWTLIWGPCKVDGNCISSPDFPDMYPNSHECIFTGPPVDQQRLLVMDVVEFSTQSEYDYLMVNGVRYSGDVGPHEQVPRGTIAWHADAIVPASGWNICLREVHFQDLSCNFERDTCLWFSSANSTWHRVAGEVNGGNWVLEATGTVSEDRTFVLESARVNSTNSSSLTVSYQMSGSSSVSLALQSQTEASGWTTIFLRTGDKGPSWHTSFVAVPDGTIALRLLANITAVEDVVRIDSLWASHMASSEASNWTLIWGPCKVDGDCISSPDFPDTYPNSHECIFTGPPVDPQRLLVMDVVEFSTYHSDYLTYDYLMVNGVRYSGDVGPHEQVPRGTIAWHADDIGTASGWKICLREASFLQLSCDFELDTCFWFRSGNPTWQFAAGHAHDGSMSLEAAGNETEHRTFSLESTRFSATSGQGLIFSYQMMGSSSAAVELQAQQAGSWRTIFQKASDNHSTLWHSETITVPDGTVALRFTASVAAAEVVRLDSLMPVVRLSDVSCGFDRGACGWSGDFQRRKSDPFRGCCARAATNFGNFTSPWFWPTTGAAYVEFAYKIVDNSGKAALQLLYFRGEVWRVRWWRQGNNAAWQQAKVTVPVGTTMLAFLCTSTIAEFGVDEVVAWESEGQASDSISLCSGSYHNCAAHLPSGQVKCWGYADSGQLGYVGGANIGDDPNEMGLRLPPVDVGGGAIRHVACGSSFNCAVFEDGKLKCWGQSQYGELGYGYGVTRLGDLPGDMGTNLPPVDLGAGAFVESVACGMYHTCALLGGGHVKCFGQSTYLGLGEMSTTDMGDGLPPVDLGKNFTATKVVAGSQHTCALSNLGAVKCWGTGTAVGLGLSDSNDIIGAQLTQMGDNLPSLDLGLRAIQISAGSSHTCAVLEDGSVRCWGRNSNGQLGHGDSTDRPFADSSLPATSLGFGMIAVRIAAGYWHTCAILQDDSLKCWGNGFWGQLGQGSITDIGVEESQMGNNLPPVDLAEHGVRHVSVGYGHTCAQLDDDSMRCWGYNWGGELGIGSTVTVGFQSGQMGAALAVTDVFHITPGSALEDLQIIGGTATSGILEIKYNGSLGLICDDNWNEAAARVACRSLGLGGGRPAFTDTDSGEILADNIICQGIESGLHECRFRGWRVHDCTPKEAAGVQCSLDVWSDLPSAGPPARQDHSLVWDAEAQSAVVFGGQAGSTFTYFDDLWRYSSLRTWSQILAAGPGPGPRFGHTAVWDVHSRSMLVFGGRHLGNPFAELWRFASDQEFWESLSPPSAPQARSHHTACWDEFSGTMVILAGEDLDVLADMHTYSIMHNRWTASTATQGPGPRVRHAAVWDDTTRAMLVFGGWDGAHYLGDLWHYSAWSSVWTELAASSGPRPRAGHRAAWDPASMSFLVFGGVTNVSGSLRYDDELYNFSLLAGWAHLQKFPRPSGRSGTALAWDAESRGLLVFGGFNSTYNNDTWRYVASPTAAARIVRCPLGQSCRMNDTSVVKRSCTDPEIMEGSAAGDADAAHPRLAVEPGTYHLCRPDVGEAVGLFIAEGPLADQSAECFLGSQCTVAPWQGVGISTNDSLFLRKSCATAELSAHSGNAEVRIDFESSANSFSLDLGRLDAASGPEDVELCWCPGSRSCAGSGDFAVLALRMSILCRPGEFQDELETICRSCPADRFCPGGRAVLSCPSGSTSLPGSRDLSQCQCVQGQYWSSGSQSCLTCPYGSTTLQAGATSLDSCTCLPDFVNTDAANPAACECGPGIGFDPQRGVCQACPRGAYKANAGNRLCSGCPEDQTTLQEASTSALECLCRAGFSRPENESDGSCINCRPGFFCNGTGIAFSCPDGATSLQAARSLQDCFCEAGRYKDGSSCKLCPSGRYNPFGGNEASCPLQCPTSSSSANGSSSLEDCFCLPGFHAQTESGSLARCVSCAMLATLRCPGGFEGTGRRHQQPLAKPGFFQTGVVTAFKCNVVLEDGRSTCLGGGFCASVEDGRGCMGKYGNSCEEGSLGFLCGECLPGWARTEFQAPCQRCHESPLPLIASILVDVGSKAAISFAVASMAATAAVRGSSKLHTIMIRITSHWLASCSVLATFDLSQITFVFWEEQSADPRPSFPWPPEITAAMRSLFNEISLAPSLVSLEFAVQCYAQDIFPRDPLAPRVAVGVYYVCLPILVTLTVLLYSWLAVHAVVPLAARHGHSFNEAGKQRKAVEKGQQQLREAVEEALRHAGLSGLSWAEIQKSGATDLPLSELKQAAKDPDAFLRQAVASSPSLLQKACTCRAASQDLQIAELALPTDLAAFLRSQAATPAADLVCMLDGVLQEILPKQLASDDQGASTSQVVVHQPIKEAREPDVERDRLQAQVTVEDMAVDEVMGHLDFGLFDAKPRFAELMYQCVPIIWIALITLWPGLLSSFLRMLWCVPFEEDDRDDVSRLLPNPDVECWTEAHFPSAALAIGGLVIWCLGTPLALALKLQSMQDRRAPNSDRRYGYFFQGLEPKFWWWDILVKRADVGMMMLVTYTSVVPTPVAKLLLFPVLSGFQACLAAWVKPYVNDQAGLLDMLEVILTGIRFLLFSSVSSLLVMNTSPEITRGTAYLLFLVLVVTCIYFVLHMVAQVLRDASTRTADTGSLGALKRFFIELALPLFQEPKSEMFQLAWSFDPAEIKAVAPKGRTARLTSFATAMRKLRLRAWQILRSSRGAVLRLGTSFQHAVLVKASEEFMVLWLQQLDQPDLPPNSHLILCVLATTQQESNFSGCPAVHLQSEF